MTGLSYNTLIVLAGTGLLGANAGLVGAFAVLRGRSLTGDALAHAALPGLCIAFLLVGERSLPAMMAGALASGLLGVLVISLLHRATRVKEDAAIGIVLSVFFGAGIVLSRVIQNTSTTGSKAGLDSFILGKTAGILAADVFWIGGVSLFSLAVIALLYKEFQVTAFDGGFGRVQGWPVLVLDLGLMGLIALAVVFGLPAVGVVLTAAVLILPGASARFWTDRLGTMLAIATAIGLAIGLAGTAISASHAALPAGPIITLVGTGAFALSALFAPRRGALARFAEQARLRQAMDDRTLVRILFERREEGRNDVATAEITTRTGWRPARLRRAVRRATDAGLATTEPLGQLDLTSAGLRQGADEARDQRLRALYLDEHPEHTGRLSDPEAGPLAASIPPDLYESLEARLKAEGRWPDGAGS